MKYEYLSITARVRTQQQLSHWCGISSPLTVAVNKTKRWWAHAGIIQCPQTMCVSISFGKLVHTDRLKPVCLHTAVNRSSPKLPLFSVFALVLQTCTPPSGYTKHTEEIIIVYVIFHIKLLTWITCRQCRQMHIVSIILKWNKSWTHQHTLFLWPWSFVRIHKTTKNIHVLSILSQLCNFQQLFSALLCFQR